MRAVLVVPGWRVHVSEARAAELVAKGWAVELGPKDRAGELWITEAGAVELLRLVDPEALRQIAARIEGGHDRAGGTEQEVTHDGDQ